MGCRVQSDCPAVSNERKQPLVYLPAGRKILLFVLNSMKSLSTLLAALAVSGTATTLVGLDAKPALACDPYCNKKRKGFAIESSSIGSMTFSGAGLKKEINKKNNK